MKKDYWFFGGVYDGYAGRDASKIAKSKLHEIFKKYLKHGDVKLVFAQTYDDVSNAIKKTTRAGTTAANVFIAGVRLWTAHAGDSRIIICQDNKLMFSTSDHNPANTEETKIILARGGRILGDKFFVDNHILPVSRALGDRDLSYVLWSKPDVYELNLAQLAKEGTIRIVICSHGVFERGIIKPEEVPSIVNSYESAKDSAKALFNLAFIRGATENLTVMAIKLIPKTRAKKGVKPRIVLTDTISNKKLQPTLLEPTPLPPTPPLVLPVEPLTPSVELSLAPPAPETTTLDIGEMLVEDHKAAFEEPDISEEERIRLRSRLRIK